jgi:hypothetical protein
MSAHNNMATHDLEQFGELEAEGLYGARIHLCFREGIGHLNMGPLRRLTRLSRRVIT